MKKACLCILFAFIFVSCSSTNRYDITGDWGGMLVVSNGTLYTVIDISNENNIYEVMARFPAIGNTEYPFDLKVEQDVFVFSEEETGVLYIAELIDDQLVGRFTQDDQVMERFTLSRLD